LIDNKISGTYYLADLILPTAVTGVETDGLAFRFDHVPIELKKIRNPPIEIPSDEELLDKIINRLEES
ncbi:MAG: formylmethanofuran dehydrogenase subunit B, partial [Candidatus Lokiarchaeota archaeon]|nr:formylmethanofuran dehydrogenase subunit B [Candidatus Lokiarchaeota archaeon]